MLGISVALEKKTWEFCSMDKGESSISIFFNKSTEFKGTMQNLDVPKIDIVVVPIYRRY